MSTLEEELEETLHLIDSYQDLATEQEDDDSFVARGNGFCDRKYSDDFLQMQIAQLTARAAAIKKEMQKQ